MWLNNDDGSIAVLKPCLWSFSTYNLSSMLTDKHTILVSWPLSKTGVSNVPAWWYVGNGKAGKVFCLQCIIAEISHSTVCCLSSNIVPYFLL